GLAATALCTSARTRSITRPSPRAPSPTRARETPRDRRHQQQPELCCTQGPPHRQRLPIITHRAPHCFFYSRRRSNRAASSLRKICAAWRTLRAPFLSPPASRGADQPPSISSGEALPAALLLITFAVWQAGDTGRLPVS